jgi:hypothetical protein
VSDSRLRLITVFGLVSGAILGMAGSFAPSASLRGLAWGLDGAALVLATALLTVHHLRRGNELLAAGFLLFVAGQSLVLSGAAMDLVASVPLFAAGAILWSASLVLVSSSTAMPALVRGTGFVGSLLFGIVAIQTFLGRPLTFLSEPLPFFAYPFLAATLLGWAWVHYRAGEHRLEAEAGAGRDLGRNRLE